MRHSTNLDVLRAFAVMLVFGNHLFCTATPWRNSFGDGLARFGVLLFFVHTSCVLMGSLQSVRSEGGSWVSRFYARRFFRLYPLSIVVVVLGALLTTPMMPWGNPEAAPHSVAVLVSNLLLIQNATGQPSVLSVSWSLPIEVEMYLVLPLVFLLVRSRNWKRKMAQLWGATAVLIVAGQAAASAVFHGTHRFEALQLIPCFLCGAIAYAATRPARPWPSYLWMPALLTISIAGANVAGFAPGFWACCLAVALLYPQVAEMPRNSFTRLCSLIAKYSYGIYLTHCFGLWIFYQLLGAQFHPAIRLAGVVLFTAAASAAAFHLIEDPMIRLGKRLTSGGAGAEPAQPHSHHTQPQTAVA